MLVIDCGDIGPSYQPGHTHCDFLSYELMLSGQMVITDTGVCEYEPGDTRHYLRSTAAHNVVAVDGDEQSEIWGEFRVARRAKKLAAQVELKNAQWCFEGSFQGFYGVKGETIHSRKIDVDYNAHGKVTAIHFEDTVAGVGEHLLESFIHMHPDVGIEQGEKLLYLIRDGVRFAELTYSKGLECQVGESPYYPEFGLKLRRKSVILSIKAQFPAQLGYTITPLY